MAWIHHTFVDEFAVHLDKNQTSKICNQLANRNVDIHIWIQFNSRKVINICTDNNRLSFAMDLAFEAVCKVGIEADKKSFGYQCNVGKPQTIGPFQGHQKNEKRESITCVE